MEAKNGGGLSSMRVRRMARRSSGERGKGTVMTSVNGFKAIEGGARCGGL
jgi:hypothetical protein